MVNAFQGAVVDMMAECVDQANLDVLEEIIDAAQECSDMTESTDATCDGDPATEDAGAIALGGKEAMLGSTASVALIEYVKDGIQNIAAVGSGVGTQESKCSKLVQQKLSSLT